MNVIRHTADSLRVATPNGTALIVCPLAVTEDELHTHILADIALRYGVRLDELEVAVMPHFAERKPTFRGQKRYTLRQPMEAA